MNDLIQMDGIFSKGYGFISKMVMQDKELHAMSKALYAYICSYSGAGKTAFPSREKICYDMGMNKDTFQKYIKLLVERGYVVIEKVKNAGKFSSNLYKVVTSPCLKLSDTVSPDMVKPDTNNNNLNNNSFNNKKIMNHDSDMTLFENLFKEFGINFTKTNQTSVKRLLKSMKLEEVKSYLIETYRNLKENPEVQSIAGVFSKKIATGERQAAYKAPVENLQEAEKTSDEVKAELEAAAKKDIIKTVNALIDSVSANILARDEAISKFDYTYSKGPISGYTNLIAEYRQKLIDNL